MVTEKVPFLLQIWACPRIVEETGVRYTRRKGAENITVQKRKYDAAFKQEALRLLDVSGKSVRQIEEDLGITQELLNKWKVRYRLHPATGEVALSEQHDLEAENRRLRRELELVKAERELLKKVVKLFLVDAP
jgi:transposase